MIPLEMKILPCSSALDRRGIVELWDAHLLRHNIFVPAANPLSLCYLYLFIYFGEWSNTSRLPPFESVHDHARCLGEGGREAGRGVRETPSRQMQLKRTDGADRRESLRGSCGEIDALISRGCAIYARRSGRRGALLDSGLVWDSGWTRSCPLKWTERQTRTRGGRSSFLCLPLW